MDEQEKAILETLWETWVNEPPAVPDNGNRLFIRTVDMDPDDPGWDDWRLVGLANADGSITWNVPEDTDSFVGCVILQEIADGGRHGRITYETLHLEWGLFVGDGPVESRVSDWAKGQPT